MRMTVVDKLRAFARTGPRPDVNPDVAPARTAPSLKQRVARASSRLSHGVFIGLLAFAVLPRTEPAAERAPIPKAPPAREMKRAKQSELAKAVAPSAIAPTPAKYQRAAPEAVKEPVRTPPSIRDLPLSIARVAELPPPRLIAQISPPIKSVPLLALRKRDAVTLLPPPRKALTVTEREIKIIVEAEPVVAVAPPAKPAATIGVAKRASAFTVVNAWSNEQIAEARAICARIITSADIVATEAEPVREGSCGAPAPITVSQLGAPKVKIQPAAMLTCPMAAALNTWMTSKVQPAALAAFGVPVTRLISASSYSCRNRYGRTDTQLSEHALINALDLSGFVLADGRSVRVSQDWGAVARDAVTPDKKPEAKPDIPVPVAVKIETAKPSFKAGLSLLGGKSLAKFISPKDVEAAKARLASTASTDTAQKAAASEQDFRARQRDFLHRVHAGACDVFGTVLGPEANDAHRDHFHLDMKPRRHKAYCQ